MGYGAVEWVELTQPPNFRPQIRPVILSAPTNSPQLEQYNRVRGSSAKHAPKGGPGKTQRSGLVGERRSSEMNALAASCRHK